MCDAQLQGSVSGDVQFLASSVSGEWHFAAVTFSEGGGTSTAYIDGQRGSSPATGDVPSRATPLFVGASSSSLLNALSGNVYDVRVYNRALGAAELRQLWAEMSHKLQVSLAEEGGWNTVLLGYGWVVSKWLGGWVAGMVGG